METVALTTVHNILMYTLYFWYVIIHLIFKCKTGKMFFIVIFQTTIKRMSYLSTGYFCIHFIIKCDGGLKYILKNKDPCCRQTRSKVLTPL